MSIIPLERFSKMVNENDQPTERTSEWTEAITRQVNSGAIISGTGSPEGVYAAKATALYMNIAGAPGAILYIKKTGTGNTGWSLV